MIPEYEKLTNDSLFKTWQEQHSKAFLTHFFCQIDKDLNKKSSWEVGYYDHDKITVFVVNEKIEIKPEDDVFKKPNESVEKLELDKVKVSFEEAVKVFKEEFSKVFPEAQLGDGFLILQKYQNLLLWNFTLIDKRLKFLNLKIDAVSGKVSSHQAVDLVQKGKSS
tara:strand:+ start:307 stop:801 length:495 start_codon:yes stop_codon:yes gene_type:complete